ncbi:MAG: DAK2 domain-containing protein [Clostridia bacterium]
MIKGCQLRDAIISASNNLKNNKKRTNDLNIFPVPDGDTGTNMSMTINAAAVKLAELNDACTACEVAKLTASAMLRGARGNSGVILSLLFRGFSVGLAEQEEADASALVKALKVGVEEAYSAVMKPTEGTILTVARVASELGEAALEMSDDAIYIWSAICKGASEALEETPELLPVLKKAGVVDAGGFGLCLIFEGMLSVIKHGDIIPLKADEDDEEESTTALAEWEGEITFTYCTEFIVGRNEECQTSPVELRDYLETLGDCVVVVDDEDIIKVHVHTENPGKAMQKGLEFGELLTVKVENMREQNRQAKAAKDAERLKFQEPTEEYGFVSICAGDGLKDLFVDLGCMQVVSGGQTMNPSTADITEAILATPAKTVYVLPNNKNIILAAEQAVPFVTDRKVIIIPTKTIPQGISAMLAFDDFSAEDENVTNMNVAITNVGTGLVTFAARNSEYGGHKIKEGDILGLVNGKMDYIAKTASSACLKVAKSLVNKQSNFVTLIYGSDTQEEEAVQMYETLRAKLGSNIEISLVNGGQPIYYYIISVE